MKMFVTAVLVLLAVVVSAQSSYLKTQLTEAAHLASIGKYKQADAIYDSLLVKYPADSTLLDAQGITYYRYGRLDDNLNMIEKSLAIFDNFLRSYPQDPRFHLLHGTLVVRKIKLLSVDEQKAHLPALEAALAELEGYVPKSNGSALNSIANQEISNAKLMISRIKFG